MKKFTLALLSAMLSIAVFGSICSAEQTTYYGKTTLLKAFDVYYNGTEEEWQAFFDDYLSVAGGPNSTPLDDETREKFRKSEEYLLSVTYRDIEQLKDESYYTDDYYFYFVLSDGSEYVFLCSSYDRTMYTLKEILTYSGISNAEDIVYISLRDKSFMGVEITEYNLIPYSVGWNDVDGKKYYVESDGTLQTKSCTIDGIRYSFSADGVCKGRYTGWTKSSKGKRYYKNGELVKNKWLKTKSGKRYYADEKGYVLTGEAYIKGEYCLFDEKGRLIDKNLTSLGLSFYVENVTQKGLDLVITQRADIYSEFVQTEWIGGRFRLEKMVNGEWKDVDLGDGKIWGDIEWLEDALGLSTEKENIIPINWTHLYGELPKGKYRILREYNDATYYTEFNIYETTTASDTPEPNPGMKPTQYIIVSGEKYHPFPSTGLFTKIDGKYYYYYSGGTPSKQYKYSLREAPYLDDIMNNYEPSGNAVFTSSGTELGTNMEEFDKADVYIFDDIYNADHYSLNDEIYILLVTAEPMYIVDGAEFYAFSYVQANQYLDKTR